MATLLEKYLKGPWFNAPKIGADKTPLSVDGGKNLASDENLSKFRGTPNTKKYTDGLTGDL